MLWTIAWWTGGVAGGVVALWLLAAGAGIDKPRRWLRGKGRALACGACGHGAVTPDRIATCPECGAEYAQAGLLTPRAGLRYGPPLWVVGLLLLALVVIGSALLAQVAGKAANRRAIGAAWVEEASVTHTFDPGAAYVLAVHLEQVRAPQAGAWMQSPPVLESALRVELIVGAGASGGINNPANRGLPTFSLELPAQGQSWRLLDSTGAVLDRGTGVGEGVAALYDAALLGPTAPSPQVTGDELAAVAAMAEAFQSAGSGPPAGLAPLLTTAGLAQAGTGMAVKGHHTFHRASPWGIAAGVATPAGLAVVAGLLLGAIGWLRRRMVRVR